MYSSLAKGEAKLWFVARGNGELVAAITSRIDMTAVGPVCQITYAGGQDAQNWFELVIDTVSRDARSRGAVKTVIIGRHGWQKWLGSVGFKHTQCIFVRDETDGNERNDRL